MKLKITYETVVVLPGAESIKDVDPARVAEDLQWSLNRWSDGRDHVVTEALRELLRGKVLATMWSQVFHTLADRYQPRGSGKRARIFRALTVDRMKESTFPIYTMLMTVRKNAHATQEEWIDGPIATVEVVDEDYEVQGG